MITELATRRPLLDVALTGHETLLQSQPGTVLFNEGEQPSGVYIIHSGTVDLLFRTRAGILTILWAGAPGEILGLGALISGCALDFTARVHTASRIGFVDRESFLRLLDESPALWFDALRLLSRDVHASYDTLRTAALPPVGRSAALRICKATPPAVEN